MVVTLLAQMSKEQNPAYGHRLLTVFILGRENHVLQRVDVSE